MALEAILFDLDDTLVMEVPSVDAALLLACERARARHGIDPSALTERVRENARRLWFESPIGQRYRAIGMSSWEALWAAFRDAEPETRDWAATYRQGAWECALADEGTDDPALSYLHQRQRRAS